MILTLRSFLLLAIVVIHTHSAWGLLAHHKAPKEKESCVQFLTRSAVEYLYPPALGPRAFPPNLYGELEDGDLKSYRIYVSDGMIVDRDGFGICPDIACAGTLILDGNQRMYFSTLKWPLKEKDITFSGQVTFLNGELLEANDHKAFEILGAILAKTTL